MPAPLSVIIPTLNAVEDLPATCDALLNGVTDGMIAELILSDGGSDDAIADVAEALGARLITGPRGRGHQIKRGVDAATTPWLLILHADTHLSEDWAQAVRTHMNLHPDKAGWFRLRFRARGFMPRLVAFGANLRARFPGLPYGDQGLLISQDVLASSGGIPELALMEDVVLASQLKGRLLPLAATAHTAADRYETDGWWARILLNLGTLARFYVGAHPEDLIARYERRKK